MLRLSETVALTSETFNRRGETEPLFLRNILPAQKAIDSRSFFSQSVSMKHEVTEPSLSNVANLTPGIRGPANSLHLEIDAPERRHSIREMSAMVCFNIHSLI